MPEADTDAAFGLVEAPMSMMSAIADAINTDEDAPRATPWYAEAALGVLDLTPSGLVLIVRAVRALVVPACCERGLDLKNSFQRREKNSLRARLSSLHPGARRGGFGATREQSHSSKGQQSHSSSPDPTLSRLSPHRVQILCVWAIEVMCP